MDSSWRLLRAFSILFCLAVPLAACGSGDTKNVGASSSITADPSGDSSNSSGDGGGSSSGNPSGPAAGGSSTASQGADSGGKCTATQAKVTLGQADGAAGHLMQELVFSNSSDQTCTITGYPGVSFVTAADGSQINDAAVRESGVAQTTVKLASKASARARVSMVNTGVFDEAACKPVQAAGFRVYLPDDTASTFVANQMTVCSAKGTGVPTITVVYSAS
jgi:hypothetical protein